jgi:hypothetical protein
MIAIIRPQPRCDSRPHGIRPRVLASSALTLASALLCSSSVLADRPLVDYDASFSRSFPSSGGTPAGSVGIEHPIKDWPLYAALATGDVVAYAARLDPAVAAEMEQSKGRLYQTQQLEDRIKADRRLATAFQGQRQRLKSMVVTTEASGIDTHACAHQLVYVSNEFRLVLGKSSEAGDPLSHATIAPSCPQRLEPGFQLTGGRSSRFTCWATDDSTVCGWRLPDMPVALKATIETTYPTRVTLRWRWRGLGAVVRTRYIDGSGNRVGANAGTGVTPPVDLGLDFVGENGQVLWSAPASLTRAAPTRDRTPRDRAPATQGADVNPRAK